ncbi:Response Regulator Receiver Signal Transduction Histidine Kinase [Nostoc sp. NIES-3756]|uniref:hybrid sensor histidine kinase/response regulator n=1 Tax=Nostoc sp. NIES-3756 TaxID=1751286 RepID=UPI0007217434|nr:response regulator [Nostoc sp. NIES-3756]BAT55812.1 Response Regulator Receiver Signal Transduction Histidine Kinase [Nostoc sp. NIES-3756]
MSKILVIEDDINVRQNILDLLESEGFNLIEAHNGLLGVQLAQEEIPDLIICDVMMPELDGYGVLQALRQSSETAIIPLIFLTAKSDKTDFRQGMEMGADDYIVKPFTRKELLAAIACRLEKNITIKNENQRRLDNLRNSIALSLPHEMRTPLNGILGFSQILMEESDNLDSSTIKEMAESIYLSGERLFELIQKFLMYAELEIIRNDKEQIEFLQSQTAIFPNLTVIGIIKDKAKKVDREADLQLELHPCQVNITTSKMAKIVEELLDNAFKFSPKGSPVQVKAQTIDSELILSFIDYGRGITASQIAELGAYQQFERKLYEQQGSGLGLMIAKSIAEIHGGRLKITSKPNQKTVVEVVLPCTQIIEDAHESICCQKSSNFV